MFIHIAKVVEHASNWLRAEGHAVESEIHQATQRLVNYIGHASEQEHAIEVLKKAGYTVMAPQELNKNFPEPTPNMTVTSGIQAEPIALPKVDEPAPGTVVVDGQTHEVGPAQ